MIWFIAALAAAILCGVAGQLLLKEGADAADFVSQLFRPTTIIGLGFYALAALLYIVALRKIPMSVALPCTAASYVVIAIIGHFVFGEALGTQKLAAIALISGGVVLLAATA